MYQTMEKRTDMDTSVQFEDWQLRLKEERNALLEKTIKLKKKIDDKNFKANRLEWESIQHQFHLMRELCQVLTDRCVYYGLIEGGDLGLSYDFPAKY